MKQEKIPSGHNLTGVDKMAVELLSSSLVAGEKGKIDLTQVEYSADCRCKGTDGMITTLIKKNGKQFCVVIYMTESYQESILFF